MSRRAAVVLFSLFFTTGLFAKEVFLSVTGKANGFYSDVRIFNPSYTKDITVNAQYLAGNNDNTGAAVVPLTIPKRTMKAYDDAVLSIFNRTGALELGAIRFTSDDDFQATQRVYQDARESYQKGTLGQFVAGQDVTRGVKKGVILQLKSGQASLGSFRTNWGGVNPNTALATVNFKLYDRNNQLAGTNTLTFQPYGVFSPNNIVNFFGISNADLTDAWIAFDSDQPVFLYGSVVDNGAVDQTFVAGVEDSGVEPPAPQNKTITVTAVNWSYTVTPSAALAAGDQVRVIVRATEGTHGFSLFSPTGQQLFDINPVTSTAAERTVTLQSGKYVYVCTRTSCGEGHTSMNGEFTVP
jgi:heme/copper-type cytochrome/quinol oxidase subunit 2